MQDLALPCSRVAYEQIRRYRKRALPHKYIRQVTPHLYDLNPRPSVARILDRDVLAGDFGVVFLEPLHAESFPALKKIRLSFPGLVDQRRLPRADAYLPHRGGFSTHAQPDVGEPFDLDLRHCLLDEHALSTWAGMAREANIAFVNHEYQRINPVEPEDFMESINLYDDGDESSDSSYKYSDAFATTSYEDSDEGSDAAFIPSDDERIVRVTDRQWRLEGRYATVEPRTALDDGSNKVTVDAEQVGLDEALDIFTSTLSTSSDGGYDGDGDDDIAWASRVSWNEICYDATNSETVVCNAYYPTTSGILVLLMFKLRRKC